MNKQSDVALWKQAINMLNNRRKTMIPGKYSLSDFTTEELQTLLKQLSTHNKNEKVSITDSMGIGANYTIDDGLKVISDELNERQNVFNNYDN